MWQGRFAVASLIVVALLASLSMCAVGGGRENQLEVYSWWTGPGEEEGLNAMAKEYERENPGVTFVNAAVSGGAGSNAKAILASRLLANDPPDSYQRHAGLELLDDVRSGKVQDLSSLYDQQHWRDVFPKGLLENLTINGKVYAVPVNIHRANLMWYLPSTLKSLGIDAPPKTWGEFLSQAEIIKSKGKTPLAIGPEWTQKHLLETVLLGELGPDDYEKLFAGQISWTSPDVEAALGVYAKVLQYTDLKAAAGDWQPQLDRVVQGSAVYAVMGDWTANYLEGVKKLAYESGYNVVASRDRRHLRLPLRLVHAADRGPPSRPLPGLADRVRLDRGPEPVQPAQGLDPGTDRRRRHHLQGLPLLGPRAVAQPEDPHRRFTDARCGGQQRVQRGNRLRARAVRAAC